MIEDLALARETRLRRQGVASPLIGEIAEALVILGGAADRDRVADLVARRRGGAAASPALRRELGLALKLHREHVLGDDLRPAFGTTGKTWTLAPEALAFFCKHMPRQAGG